MEWRRSVRPSPVRRTSGEESTKNFKTMEKSGGIRNGAATQRSPSDTSSGCQPDGVITSSGWNFALYDILSQPSIQKPR